MSASNRDTAASTFALAPNEMRARIFSYWEQVMRSLLA
jgi:hypothetical protein